MRKPYDTDNNQPGDSGHIALISGGLLLSTVTGQDRQHPGYPVHAAIVLNDRQRQVSGAGGSDGQRAPAAQASFVKQRSSALGGPSIDDRCCHSPEGSWTTTSRSKGAQIRFRSDVVGG